jgi:hypothetical protein
MLGTYGRRSELWLGEKFEKLARPIDMGSAKKRQVISHCQEVSMNCLLLIASTLPHHVAAET